MVCFCMLIIGRLSLSLFIFFQIACVGDSIAIFVGVFILLIRSHVDDFRYRISQERDLGSRSC